MNRYFSTSNDIYYSRPFDVHIWSNYAEFNQIVNELWSKYFSVEDTIVRRGPKPKTPTKAQKYHYWNEEIINHILYILHYTVAQNGLPFARNL